MLSPLADGGPTTYLKRPRSRSRRPRSTRFEL